MSAEANDLVVWDIASEHLDEAEFLFGDREADLDASVYTLDEMETGPDERLRANIDGLILGGKSVAEELLWPALDEVDEPDTIDRGAAAALALLAGDPAGSLPRLREILEGDEPARRAAVEAALGLAGPSVDGWLRSCLESTTHPGLGTALLRALAVRGADPGPAVETWLSIEEPEIVAAVLSAAPMIPRARVLRFAEGRVGDADPRVSALALTASLVHGSPGAWPVCRAEALAEKPRNLEAASWLAMLGDDRDREALRDRTMNAADAEHKGALLWSIGLGGRASDIVLLLASMGDEEPRVAKLAFEAFCGITGAPSDQLAADDANTDEEEQQEGLPALEDDDLDADLVGDPVDALPLPNPDAAAAWWSAHSGRYVDGQRYLYGRVAGGDALLLALRQAPMRRRHAHARELAFRTRAAHGLATRAWAFVQKQRLAQIEGARLRLDLAVPYARISGA